MSDLEQAQKSSETVLGPPLIRIEETDKEDGASLNLSEYSSLENVK